jgi:hypothetical protein
VSVNYATSDGTATEGSDYTAASDTLTWADGDTTDKTFTVAITDDAIYEGNETVNLTLSSPTGGAVLGSPISAVLTIVENDPPPLAGSLQFSSTAYGVDESGGSITITVTRTGGSYGAVNVNYAASGGTATSGADYTAPSGSLSWVDGETRDKTFTITILDDSTYEGNETVNLILSSPMGGVAVGSPGSAVLTIIENDPAGSLTVTISPPEAVVAGAKWRIGTGTWQDSGSTETGLPPGPQTVEFSDLTGWTKPFSQTVTIVDGQTTSLTGTYTQQTGSLKVTIMPQGAIDAGAQWRRVGTGDWGKYGGSTETGIPVGPQTVEFKDVAGWYTPGNQTVTIANDQTTNVTGTYTQRVGSLKVTIDPPAAVSAGAKWRRTGTSAWQNSGVTETGVPIGQQTVEFYDVAGWKDPAKQAVTINEGQTTSATGTYAQASLTVTIGPQEAVSAGAKWRRVGTSAWQNSGVTETEVPVGQQTVEFSVVAGWARPDDQTVTIANGQTVNVTGTYTQQFGSIQVMIRSNRFVGPTVVEVEAKWRRVGTNAWQNSGTTETGVPVGPRTIEFNDVPGWTKPANQTVTVSDGQTASATGTYIEQVGSLTVTISPPGAVSAGAKWRRLGGAWRNSGVKETGIPIGQQTVEFNDLPGWTKPGNQMVAITNGGTASATGAYGQGSLKVTISPQGAVSAGAKWRRVGTSTWKDSGATEMSLPLGQQTVEFSDVPGWTKPANQTVTITNGGTASATGTYGQGSLKVTISPQGAVSAGAKWRRVETRTWKDSGATETSLPLGQQTVEFNDLPGWTKPGNQTVTITIGQTASVTGTYTRLTGSLTVVIRPQEAIDAGAKWRLAGTGAWKDSGLTESGVPIGHQTVEFNDVTGWIRSVDQTVTINNGQVTTIIGNFSQRALSFPFFDDFSTDRGWLGYQTGGWERGIARAGSVEQGNPGPDVDHTGADDNMILGYAIGESYPNNLPPMDIISPPIDCSGQERVVLTFWRYLKIGGSDHASVSVSVDGNTWHPVWQSLASDGDWTPVAYDLSQFAVDQATVYVKFTMGPTGSTDTTNRYSGWNIDDLEVSSSPVFPAEGTTGTEFSVVGSGFGARKGKASIKNTSAEISLAVVDWSDGLIRCRLSKPAASGVYDLTIVPVRGSPVVEGAIEIRSPEIADIQQARDSSGQLVLAIEGDFFGTKKGKVYLSHLESPSGNQKKTSCTVTIWTNGYIECRIPDGMAPGTYDLIIANGVAAVMEPAAVTLP